MKLRRLIAMALVVIMSLPLAACGDSSTTVQTPEAPAATENADVVKIGYISPGPDTWYLRAEEGAKWAATKAGAEFISDPVLE